MTKIAPEQLEKIISEKKTEQKKIKKCISISGDVLTPNDARNEALKHRQKKRKDKGVGEGTPPYSISSELFSSLCSLKRKLQKQKTIASTGGLVIMHKNSC